MPSLLKVMTTPRLPSSKTEAVSPSVEILLQFKTESITRVPARKEKVVRSFLLRYCGQLMYCSFPEGVQFDSRRSTAL